MSDYIERLKTQTLPFLAALLGCTRKEAAEAPLSWQTFSDDKAASPVPLTKILHGSLKEHFNGLEELNVAGAGIFLTINGTDQKGRKKENIQSLRALWTDLDEKDANEPFDLEQVPLQPTMMVRSGHGVHLYWILSEVLMADPKTNQAQEALLKAIQQKLAPFGADPKVCEIARVMRIPGFRNMKGEPFPLVALAFNGGPKYTFEEIQSAFPAVARKPRPVSYEKSLPGNASGSKGSSKLERAKTYLTTCLPAISGESGHDTLYKVTIQVGPGFDLDEETTLKLLLDVYNPTCQPPWTEGEIRHKVEDAFKNAEGRGWKLKGPRRADAESITAECDSSESLPSIDVGPDEERVVDQAVKALAGRCLALFQRAGALVDIPGLLDGGPEESHWAPAIRITPKARLRELLASSAYWLGSSLDGSPKVISPPAFVVDAVEKRGFWPGVRPILGLREAPYFRPDLCLVHEPGYDSTSGIFLVRGGPTVRVPADATKEEGRKACQVLLDLVSDLPLATEVDRAAYLALLLTLCARQAIEGPVPFFLVSSNIRGAGKGLLVDVATTIAYGRALARTPSPRDENEEQKALMGFAVEATPAVLLDNLAGEFGSATFNAVLTGMTFKARLLGKNATPEIPLTTVWIGTANNPLLRADLPRRTVPIRLRSLEERPEFRADFKHPNLLAHVKTQRGSLLTAVMTIFQSYINAGLPQSTSGGVGSFPSWSGRIRGAVNWAFGVDPMEAWADETNGVDQELEALGALMSCWTSMFPDGGGHHASEAAVLVEAHPDLYSGVLEAVAALSKRRLGQESLAFPLGRVLRSYRDRHLGGRCFVNQGKDAGGVRWCLSKVEGSAKESTSSTHGGPSPLSAEEVAKLLGGELVRSATRS